MKTYKNQIILGIVVLIIILIIIFLLKSGSNPDDKNIIISLQNEKIKLLEDKLNNQENKDNWDEVETKLKDEDNLNELDDNSWLLWDWEGNFWADLNISKMYDDAIEFMKDWEFNKSIELLKTIVELEPDSSDIYEKLAESYEWIKDYDSAINIYKNLIIKYSDNYFYYKKLWELFLDKNEFEKSIVFYISWYILKWDKLTESELNSKVDKKIYNLEYETINEFVNNKEYDDLRKYIFNKYLWEVNDEYNIENN